MSGKLDRCVRLLEAFSLRGDLATRDVSQVLGVDRQTAMRDIKSLEAAGLPITREGEGNQVRYRLDPAYRRTSLRLSQGDAFALCFGRQLLNFLDETLIAEWHDDLGDKVEQGLSDAVRRRDRILHERLHYLSEPYRPYSGHDDAIDAILSSLIAGQELQLTYGGTVERDWGAVWPLALVMYRRALYLLVRLPGESQVYRLAVDRVVSAERTNTSFPYPVDFDVKRELAGGFGIAQTGEAVELVRLRFVPRVARLVRSRVWHPAQVIEELPDGSVELRFHANGRELVRLTLEFGETVEVLSPPWLRSAVRGELTRALAQYADDGPAPLG